MELSQSKMKISMLAIFEEIKDKTENCGKEFETNEKKKKPYYGVFYFLAWRILVSQPGIEPRPLQ